MNPQLLIGLVGLLTSLALVLAYFPGFIKREKGFIFLFASAFIGILVFIYEAFVLPSLQPYAIPKIMDVLPYFYLLKSCLFLIGIVLVQAIFRENK